MVTRPCPSCEADSTTSDHCWLYPDINLSTRALDPGVTRRHAVLQRSAEGWGLMDLVSTNGTWLNTDPAPLASKVVVGLHGGEWIRLGLFSVINVRRNPRETS